jgi:hypothetical protein
VRARCFRRLAEMAHQCRCQHVLDQTGLAGAADTRDADQTLQRDFDGHVPQVVLARALKDEARRVVGHHALEAHPDLFAAPKVGAGQRVGAAQRLGRAVEHDLSAALARARAHVDHAVGRQHHSRVVLHHHQRVAGVAQALHGLDDAMHVARVQADAGLVQHEQRVHQRGAERRGQVDALHLAAAERAALAVQCEVADADVAQVLQPSGDFFEEQLQRLRFSLVGRDVGHLGHRLEEAAQAVQRQQHQVVQAQARKGLQLGAGPGNPFGHEAMRRLHHGVGIGF